MVTYPLPYLDRIANFEHTAMLAKPHMYISSTTHEPQCELFSILLVAHYCLVQENMSATTFQV